MTVTPKAPTPRTGADLAERIPTITALYAELDQREARTGVALDRLTARLDRLLVQLHHHEARLNAAAHRGERNLIALAALIGDPMPEEITALLVTTDGALAPNTVTN